MRASLQLALILALSFVAEAQNNTSRRAFVSHSEERLIGWQGEKRRPQVLPSRLSHGSKRGERADRGLVERKTHHVSVGEKYAQEDRERGTWVEIISWRPRAFVIHNFMSPKECDDLIDIARPFMARSTVIDSTTGQPVVDEIRTSAQTFLNRLEYPLVTELEKRLTRFTYLPWENGEDLQILRYGVGEKYDAHHDVGELDSVSGKQLASDGGYRVATALWYLVDTELGGETAFPQSEWVDPDLGIGDWSDCAKGHVASRAKKGEALVFFSITPGNQIDPASMHAGCPVLKGIKWTATKWIHADPFRWENVRPKDAPGECADKNPQCRSWAQRGECATNKPFMIGTPGQQGSCMFSCKACTASRVE